VRWKFNGTQFGGVIRKRLHKKSCKRKSHDKGLNLERGTLGKKFQRKSEKEKNIDTPARIPQSQQLRNNKCALFFLKKMGIKVARRNTMQTLEQIEGEGRGEKGHERDQSSPGE